MCSRDPGFDYTSRESCATRAAKAADDRGNARDCRSLQTNARTVGYRGGSCRAKEKWRIETRQAGRQWRRADDRRQSAGTRHGRRARASRSTALTTDESFGRCPSRTFPSPARSATLALGEQYIAVNAGWGGGAAMREFRAGKNTARSTGRLLAFKLGGKAELPPLPPPQPIARPPSSSCYARTDKSRRPALSGALFELPRAAGGRRRRDPRPAPHVP